MAERLAGLFMVEAVEAVGAEDLIDTEHVAIFRAVIGLINAAVEVADDDDAATMEMRSIFANDFLCYLRVGLLVANVLALCRPDGEDEKVVDEQGNGIDNFGIVPFGYEGLPTMPNHAETFPTWKLIVVADALPDHLVIIGKVSIAGAGNFGNHEDVGIHAEEALDFPGKAVVDVVADDLHSGELSGDGLDEFDEALVALGNANVGEEHLGTRGIGKLIDDLKNGLQRIAGFSKRQISRLSQIDAVIDAVVPDINLNENFEGSGTVGTSYREANARELRTVGAVFPCQIRIECLGIVQPMLEDSMGVVHTTARDFLFQFVNLSNGLHGLLQIVLRVGGITELVGEVFVSLHVNKMFVGAKAEKTFEVVDVDGDGLSEHVGIVSGNRDLPEPREDGVAETDETETVAELVAVIAALMVRP